MRIVPAAVLALALGVGGCTSDQPPTPRSLETQPLGTQQPLPSAGPTTVPPPWVTKARPAVSKPPARVDDVRTTTAWEVVQHLAGTVGPRPGTSHGFALAADWVATRFLELGYGVRRQELRGPAPSPGTSMNLVATYGDVDLDKPHLVVAAHLDTPRGSPGADDNASGVGALLAVAEAVAGRRTRLPVVLLVLGSAAPVRPGDPAPGQGARAYVRVLGPDERSSLRGMVSLDRVGTGAVLPVCSATSEAGPLRAELLTAAETVGAPVRACTGDRTSDHWAFVRAGLPGVRVGGSPAAGSDVGDLPSGVDRAPLGDAARIVVSWLGGR